MLQSLVSKCFYFADNLAFFFLLENKMITQEHNLSALILQFGFLLQWVMAYTAEQR